MILLVVHSDCPPPPAHVSLGMGLVILGTNGEASHMTHEERALTISSARKALDAAGLKDTVIVAGTGGGSARDTIKLCEEAKEAGADYACVFLFCFRSARQSDLSSLSR